MAYSDYGGFAYRNGDRVVERSDFTLTPDGGFGTPGMYPGFAIIAAGGSKADVQRIAESPRGHAVLGDGPIFVTLYKQSSVGVYRLVGTEFEQVDLLLIAQDVSEDRIEVYEGKQYLDYPFAFTDDNEPTIFLIDDHRLEVRWTHEDNYYVYARLTQPDGTVWTGWSGYGVGAGLEDCGYGFSTAERETRNAELWR